jgi:hypothetical protein
MKVESEEDIPRYPALACCVAVDSRIRSRQGLVRELTDTQLFQSVLEASSFSEAACLLREKEVDTCVIGPSILPESANSLMDQLSGRSRSRDCAFLVLSPSPSEPYEGPAHYYATYPCARAKLVGALVQAVIRANANSPWAPIHNLLTGRSLPEGGDAPPIEEAGGLPSETGERLAQVMKVAARLQFGTFLFKPDGTATSTTANAVRQLVDDFCPGDGSQTREGLRTGLELAFYQWLRDSRTGSKKAATEKLRRAIIDLLH